MRDQTSPALHHNEGVLRQSRVARELPDRASILRLRFARTVIGAISVSSPYSSTSYRQSYFLSYRSRTPASTPDLFTCPLDNDVRVAAQMHRDERIDAKRSPGWGYRC